MLIVLVQLCSHIKKNLGLFLHSTLSDPQVFGLLVLNLFLYDYKKDAAAPDIKTYF